MNEDNLLIVVVIVLLIFIYIWLKYFLIIIRSDNVNFVKLILVVLIFSFPFAPIIFHLYKIAFIRTVNDFKSGGPQRRIGAATSIGGGLFGWLFK